MVAGMTSEHTGEMHRAQSATVGHEEENNTTVGESYVTSYDTYDGNNISGQISGIEGEKCRHWCDKMRGVVAHLLEDGSISGDVLRICGKPAKENSGGWCVGATGMR